MTRPSKRELESDLEDLTDDTGDDTTLLDVCCSWKDDCEHDERDIVIDFTAIDT